MPQPTIKHDDFQCRASEIAWECTCKPRIKPYNQCSLSLAIHVAKVLAIQWNLSAEFKAGRAWQGSQLQHVKTGYPVRGFQASWHCILAIRNMVRQKHVLFCEHGFPQHRNVTIPFFWTFAVPNRFSSPGWSDRTLFTCRSFICMFIHFLFIHQDDVQIGMLFCIGTKSDTSELASEQIILHGHLCNCSATNQFFKCFFVVHQPKWLFNQPKSLPGRPVQRHSRSGGVDAGRLGHPSVRRQLLLKQERMTPLVHAVVGWG